MLCFGVLRFDKHPYESLLMPFVETDNNHLYAENYL